MTIYVCPLSRLPEMLHRYDPARVVSLLDPGSDFPKLGPVYVGRHLRLEFHDIHSYVEHLVAPSASHIELLFRFFKRWDPRDVMLIHCHAGLGRSTAAAFIAACYHNPDADEHAIAAQLRQASPHSRPNATLVRIADNALGRHGRMSAAIADTGRDLPWPNVSEGTPFEIPSKYPKSR